MRRRQIRRVANIACSGARKGKPSPDVDSEYQTACVVEMMERKYRQHGAHPTRRGRAVDVCCVEHRPCARATYLEGCLGPSQPYLQHASSRRTRQTSPGMVCFLHVATEPRLVPATLARATAQRLLCTLQQEIMMPISARQHPDRLADAVWPLTSSHLAEANMASGAAARYAVPLLLACMHPL
jgi:hypothetical protein